MKHLNIQPTFGEEESLTAYLFDELGADQRADLERRLAEDAALRERLAELREALAFAREALADEPLQPVLSPGALDRMRAELGLSRDEGAKVVEVAPGGGEDKAEAFARRNPRFVKFLYYAGTISAAATFVVAVFGPPVMRLRQEHRVSRVKADQRSLAGAIDSYYVDNNEYPAVDGEASAVAAAQPLAGQTKTITLYSDNGEAAAVAAAQPARPLDGKAVASEPAAVAPAADSGRLATKVAPDPMRVTAPPDKSNSFMFRAGDIYKDGRMRREDVAPSFQKLFDSYDLDGDGVITQGVNESRPASAAKVASGAPKAPAAAPAEPAKPASAPAGQPLAMKEVAIASQPLPATGPEEEVVGIVHGNVNEADLEPIEREEVKDQAKLSTDGAAASPPAPQSPAAPKVGAEIASASSAEERARSFDADFDVSGLPKSVAQKGVAERKQGGQPGQVIARVRTPPAAGAPTSVGSQEATGSSANNVYYSTETILEPRTFYIYSAGPDGGLSSAEETQPLARRQLAAAMPVPPVEERRERGVPPGPQFVDHGVNPFVETKSDALSTFAIDVDKASYVMARNYLNRGGLPPAAAVRVEEVVNYFPANYPPPASSDFAVYGEMAPSPFGAGFQLLRIGVKGREIPASARKPLVLTFVIDVSGSMQEPNKLVLVKRTLQALLMKLREDDKVGVAVYGTNGRELMPHVSAADGGRITAAIDALGDEGSTNAGEGLLVGYAMARRAFDRSAVNRVILCSDGVANTGATHPEAILAQVAQSAGADIYLTTLGFGMGTYNDALMEKLADKGNGHYAYLDSDGEARHFLETDLLGSMEVIAQDCKIQVEFDPAAVAQYRLLGFENRDVADKDFRNDKVDAGEIGAGHSVTALYELQLAEGSEAATVATVRVRYKKPGAEGETMPVKEIAGELKRGEIAREFAKTEPSFKLAACAAEFAEILRNSYWARGAKMEEAAKLFDASFPGNPPGPEAAELRGLMDVAAKLTAGARPAPVAPAPPRRPMPEELDRAPKAIEMRD